MLLRPYLQRLYEWLQVCGIEAPEVRAEDRGTGDGLDAGHGDEVEVAAL